MKPWFHSEKYGSAPYRNCRGCSGANATMLATNNEANLNNEHRPKGKGGRIATAKKGWRAFATQTPADSNGWADQGDVRLMHQAMFPGLPNPTIHRSRSWDAVRDRVYGEKYAISLAIDTRVLPASDALRRYVGGVPHQGVVWSDDGTARWMCPMHNPSDTYIGHRFSWASLKRAALAIENDPYFYFEAYPIGGWTEKELAIKAKRETIRDLRAEMAKRIEQRDNARSELTALRLTNEQLQRLLDDDVAGDEAAHIAAIDQVLELFPDFIEQVEALKE